MQTDPGERRAGTRKFADLATCAVLLAGCAQGIGRPRDHDSLPGYAIAAGLKPCDRIGTTDLNRITGRPARIDRIPKGLGGIGQRSQLSTGAVLPKVWSATCSWTTGLYLQVELAPDAADARAEFSAIISKMGIGMRPARGPGNDQEWVFKAFSSGDVGTVIVVIWQGPEVVNVQLPWSPDRPGSAASQMAKAKKIARVIVMALK